ncbi:MAG: hypothetical protein GX349_03290 [Firmicutes bacterium]|nr:hypothetical protein [Bacillota bacterium]
MRRVVLTMTEQQKYKTIKKLVETNGNKNRAAIELGCSRRHVNRLVKGYKEQGKVSHWATEENAIKKENNPVGF